MKTIHSQKRYCDYNFDIRWMLMYSNKPRKFGYWTTATDDPLAMASNQCRDQLVAAGIELRNRRTQETKVVCLAVASHYVEHRVIMATAAPIHLRNTKIVGAVQGMTLVTWDQKVDVYIDGRVITKANEERSATYG